MQGLQWRWKGLQWLFHFWGSSQRRYWIKRNRNQVLHWMSLDLKMKLNQPKTWLFSVFFHQKSDHASPKFLQYQYFESVYSLHSKTRVRRPVLETKTTFPNSRRRPNQTAAIRLSTEGKKEASPGFKFLFNNIVNIGCALLLTGQRGLCRRSDVCPKRCRVEWTDPSIAQSVLRGGRRGRWRRSRSTWRGRRWSCATSRPAAGLSRPRGGRATWWHWRKRRWWGRRKRSKRPEINQDQSVLTPKSCFEDLIVFWKRVLFRPGCDFSELPNAIVKTVGEYLYGFHSEESRGY